MIVALAVWLLPGGGEGSDLVAKILTATFIVVAVVILGSLHRQHGGEIFGLGEQWRFALYALIGVALLTVSVIGRVWNVGGC